jgi:hypothetical protein
MGTHMKTTIDIADALLVEAKRVAAEEHTTLRALVERGLRETLAEKKPRTPFKLKDMSVDGGGLTEEWQRATWDEKLEIIYGDRA